MWKPIETAPTDGTEVWLFSKVHHQVVGKFHTEYGLWVFADELLDEIIPEGPEPTHWMEKPNDPEA